MTAQALTYLHIPNTQAAYNFLTHAQNKTFSIPYGTA